MPNHYIPRVQITCAVCGKVEFRERRMTVNRQWIACSKSCSGKIRGRLNLKAERRTDRNGYVFLYLPGHPHARKGWVAEHRVVVERILGRFLEPDEVVHHRNGAKGDNRPENLERLTPIEHGRLHVGRGERHRNAKWSDEQIAEIKRRYAAGEKQADLCREFRMSPPHMCQMLKGLKRIYSWGSPSR